MIGIKNDKGAILDRDYAKVTKRYASLAKRLQDRLEQADGMEHSESQPLELFQDI